MKLAMLILLVAISNAAMAASTFSCASSEVTRDATPVQDQIVKGYPSISRPGSLEATLMNFNKTLTFKAYGYQNPGETPHIFYTVLDSSTQPTGVFSKDVPKATSIVMDYNETNGNRLQIDCRLQNATP